MFSGIERYTGRLEHRNLVAITILIQNGAFDGTEYLILVARPISIDRRQNQRMAILVIHCLGFCLIVCLIDAQRGVPRRLAETE